MVSTLAFEVRDIGSIPITAVDPCIVYPYHIMQIAHGKGWKHIQ